MKSLLNKIKQYFCKHDFHSFGEEKYIGDTLSWGLNEVPQFECIYKCSKCGKEKSRQYIYYGNCIKKDGSYNFNS